MKRFILSTVLFIACMMTANAQRFALIDMEYICLLYTSDAADE